MADEEPITESQAEQKHFEEYDQAIYDKSGKTTKLPITYNVSGTAYIMRGGKKIPLKYSTRKTNQLEDGDRIVTERGFVWNITDGTTPSDKTAESAEIVMFPHSEMVLSIDVFDKKEEGWGLTGCMISKVELVKGLFSVRMTTKMQLGEKLVLPMSGYPQLEFKPDYGEFGKKKELNAFIELDKGTVTVFGTTIRVVHKGLGTEARIGVPSMAHAKITATMDALYATNLVEFPDQRASIAFKMGTHMGNETVKGSDEEGEWFDLPPYTPPREEDKITKREAERGMKGHDAQVDEYWTTERSREDALNARVKQMREDFKKEYEYAPRALVEKMELELKKRIEETCDESSREWNRNLEKSREKQRELIDAGKKGITATTKKANINKSLVYRGVSFGFTTAEKGIEMGLRKSKAGMEFLMILFKVSNSSKKQLFFCPNEEFRIFAEGKTIPLENYKLETNMDAGYSSDGNLLFIVPEGAKDFILEFGKKVGENVKVDIKI